MEIILRWGSYKISQDYITLCFLRPVNLECNVDYLLRLATKRF